MRMSIEVPYSRRMNKTILKNSLGGTLKHPLVDPVKAYSSIGRKTLVSSIDYPKGAFKFNDQTIKQ